MTYIVKLAKQSSSSAFFQVDIKADLRSNSALLEANLMRRTAKIKDAG